jgi:pSer/pThr/pTyr-binding forkhead associated (FHA) protein
MANENYGAMPVADAVPLSTAEVPAAKLPPGSQPRLVVVRGQKVNVEYPIYEGQNYVGRSDENPVDIDLDDQEPQERSWVSRQHAVITFANDEVVIEDLNSANGTYVNRVRVAPGQKRGLAPEDNVQIGTIHFKLKV